MEYSLQHQPKSGRPIGKTLMKQDPQDQELPNLAATRQIFVRMPGCPPCFLLFFWTGIVAFGQMFHLIVLINKPVGRFSIEEHPHLYVEIILRLIQSVVTVIIMTHIVWAVTCPLKISKMMYYSTFCAMLVLTILTIAWTIKEAHHHHKVCFACGKSNNESILAEELKYFYTTVKNRTDIVIWLNEKLGQWSCCEFYNKINGRNIGEEEPPSSNKLCCIDLKSECKNFSFSDSDLNNSIFNIDTLVCLLKDTYDALGLLNFYDMLRMSLIAFFQIIPQFFVSFLWLSTFKPENLET